jgi:aspartate/methionine/tyrosine aminotransferase
MKFSKRSDTFASQGSPLVHAHFLCAQDLYDETNPTGYLHLGTAQNHLMDDVLSPYLKEKAQVFPEDLHYACLHGAEYFRERCATLLQNYLHIPGAKSENIVILSGATGVLEALSFCLLDEGEGIMIPAPFYSGFTHDLQTRFHGRIIPVPLDPEKGYALEREAFEKAFSMATQAGISIKAILLNHPHNPTGKIFPETELRQICDFARAHDLHVVSDEIYALSTHQPTDHQSLLTLHDPDFTHLIYGFAKDFCLSGFKLGLFYSENQDLLTRMQNISLFYGLSTAPQRLVAPLLSKPFLDTFLQESQKRLCTQLRRAKEGLETTLDVSCYPTQAGPFLWVDLRRYLPKEKTPETELALHTRWLHEYKINISPGQFFSSPQSGFFRFVLAQPQSVLDELLVRVRKEKEHRP